MKKIIYLIAVAGVTCGLASCSDDFLERVPQTNITGSGFFKTPDDLKTYVNGLYSDGTLWPGGSYDDFESDNVTLYGMSSQTWTMIRGTLSEETATGWGSWGSLRSVNFMLYNSGNVSGSSEEIRNYIGIARYMRAYLYMNLVATYSDVPWSSKPMETDDPDLYKPADPRALVVDSIMADLEYAVANISAGMGNKTRIHKYAALALLARFSLQEGTWRKYHPELNLASTADRFLQRAVSACEEIISSGQFEITGSGVQELENGILASEAYRALFQSQDLSGNREIIQWYDYNKTFNRQVGVGRVRGLDFGMSRSFIESYLMKDGTPFTATAGYATKTFTEIFTGRDPRMAETVAWPGYADPFPYYPRPVVGGYAQIKFYARNPDWRASSDGAWEAILIYRYAEILLILAEAKAELGSITQTDLDMSVNQLRSRVGMPAMSLEAANGAVDPILAGQYPNVGGANKGVILEIRRERRIELACEGHRLRDLNRWYAGKLFGTLQQGIYIPALGAYDVTGDGIEDVAILQSPGETGPVSSLPDEVRESLQLYYLKDANGNDNEIYLENGTSGHIMMTADRLLGRVFEEPKFYYRPIPQRQIVLNPNLKQPFGW
jgi:hypothetical protein